MHKPYENNLKHPCDFRVKYRFLTKEEGGRKGILPYQGYRSDFWYDTSENKSNAVFMINPEFEDGLGEVILQNDCSVPNEGTARMWILFPERRPFHQDRIKIGLRGYFMEGLTRVAECEIIEIVGLNSNPIK